MAEVKKVVRQIITKDAAGNDVVLDIGSDETRILVDDGTRTLDMKLDDFIKVTDHPFFSALMSDQPVHPLLESIVTGRTVTYGDLAGIPRDEQGKK